jgi:hypothetical protein
MDALLQRFASAGGMGRRNDSLGERPQSANHVWRALLRAQGIGAWRNALTDTTKHVCVTKAAFLSEAVSCARSFTQ